MICASVPLCEVLSHIDAIFGIENDASPLSRRDTPVYEIDLSELAEPVFVLTSLRRAA